MCDPVLFCLGWTSLFPTAQAHALTHPTAVWNAQVVCIHPHNLLRKEHCMSCASFRTFELWWTWYLLYDDSMFVPAPISLFRLLGECHCMTTPLTLQLDDKQFHLSPVPHCVSPVLTSFEAYSYRSDGSSGSPSPPSFFCQRNGCILLLEQISNNEY